MKREDRFLRRLLDEIKSNRDYDFVKGAAESLTSTMIQEGKFPASGFIVTLSGDWWLAVTLVPEGEMRMRIPKPSSMDFMEDSIKTP